jgi:hypothetical protein
MPKNTKALSGPAAQKYMRDLLKADPGVSPDATERLVATCGNEIAQLRVRLPIPIRHKLKLATPAPAAEPSAAPLAAHSLVAKPAAAKPAAAFDPFAFSAIVVLTKQGPDGLLAKLSAITEPADLKAIAKAQHIALPPSAQTADELRTALVTGTAARIADRQAATS